MTKREKKQLGHLRVKEAREKALTRFREAKPKLVGLAVRALTEAKAKIDGGKLKEAGLDEAKLRLGKLGERMKNLAAALAAPKADAKSIASDIKTDLDELMQAAGISAEQMDAGYADEAKTGYEAPRREESEDEDEDEAATKLGDKTPRRMAYEDEGAEDEEAEAEDEDESEDEDEGYEDDEEDESEDEDDAADEGYMADESEDEDEDEFEDEDEDEFEDEEDEDEGDINIKHDGGDDADDSGLGMDGDQDQDEQDPDAADMGDEDQGDEQDQDAAEEEDEDEAGAQKMQFKCAKCGEGNVVLPPKGMKLVASEAARAASEAMKGLRGLANRLRESLRAKEGRMSKQNAKVREAATKAERLVRENKQLKETNRKLRAANMAERRMREAKRMLAESQIPAGILSASDLVQFEPHQWSTQIKLARRTVRTQESQNYGDGNRPSDARPLSEAQSTDLAAKAASAFQTEYKR